MDQEENSPWQYKPDGQPGNSADAPAAAPAAKAAHRRHETIAWQADEFIYHPHGLDWYGLLILTTAALAAGIYFVTTDIIATVTFVIVGIIVGVFASHKPRQIQYEISHSGLKIGEKTYAYGAYKSFAIIREGNLSSVNLFPLKRFMPPVSAYFPPHEEKKIVDTIGNYLPYEDRKLDGVDRLARRLHL